MKSALLTSLSVFVPAYNEEANISLLIEDALIYLPKVAKKFEIIIVDDGSQDHTREIVSTYSKQYPVVRLVSHVKNQGYGAAIKTGLKSVRYEWTFFTDSDRQFRFDELQNFLQYTRKYDFVVGFRRIRRDPILRLILAQVFLRLWNYVLFNLKFKDIDCAYKLIPTKLIKNINLTTSSAITVTELMYRLISRGYQYAEIPVTHYKRLYGTQTGSNPKVIMRALSESIALWQKLRSHR